MRRLIDSLLLVLVAYSVTWPIVRSIAAEPPVPMSRSAPADARIVPLTGRAAPPHARLGIRVEFPDRDPRLVGAISEADGSFRAALALPLPAPDAEPTTLTVLDGHGRPLGRLELVPDMTRARVVCDR